MNYKLDKFFTEQQNNDAVDRFFSVRIVASQFNFLLETHSFSLLGYLLVDTIALFFFDFHFQFNQVRGFQLWVVLIVPLQLDDRCNTTEDLKHLIFSPMQCAHKFVVMLHNILFLADILSEVNRRRLENRLFLSTILTVSFWKEFWRSFAILLLCCVVQWFLAGWDMKLHFIEREIKRFLIHSKNYVRL